MSSNLNNNTKEVYFNPDMKFENLSYNIEKNNNSIVQEMDIDLEGFENELNMNGGSNIDNQLSEKNMEIINEKFNTINSLDPTLNQLGGNNETLNKSNIEQPLTNIEQPLTNIEQPLTNIEQPLTNIEQPLTSNLNMEENDNLNMEENDNLDMDENDNLDMDENDNLDMDENDNLDMDENDNLDMDENNNLDMDENDNLVGGSKETDELDIDDIDLNISSYKEIIHPLVNINSVKKCVNNWINNLKSSKYIKYNESIKNIFQKNTKKYKTIRKNKKIILIDRKTNVQVESISIPDFKIISIEKKRLKDNIIKLKQKLIHLYLDIKNEPKLKEKYSLIYKKTLNNYSSVLELLTSYNIYENIINEEQITDDNENNNTTTTTIFLPDLNTDIYEQSKVFIENHHYEIDDELIQITQQINREKSDLYYNINMELDNNNENTMKDKKNIKDLIKEYLDNSNLKTVKNKINTLKQKQNNKITFIIDKFN